VRAANDPALSDGVATNPTPATTQAESNGTPETAERLLNVTTSRRPKSNAPWKLHQMPWAGLLVDLDLANPADHQECGGYVPGLFRSSKRNDEYFVSRSVLTLDADEAKSSFLDDVARVLPGVAAAVHTTWSDGVKGNRWRLLVPLSRDVDADEYRRLHQAVRDALGDHWGADKGCPSPVQFMWRPSTQNKGTYVSHVQSGELLDVDAWLQDEPEVEPPAPQPEARALHPYAKAAIDGELARLDECDLMGWSGPPWDNTTLAVACNLIEFANSPWSGYTLDQAEADLMDRAPTDDGFGPKEHASKWASAAKKVGRKGRPQPSGDPGDGFEAVGVKPIDGDTEPDAKQPLSVKLREHVQEHYDAFPATADKRIFVQPKRGGRAELPTKNFVIRAAGHLGKKAASLSQPATEAATVLTAWALHEPPRTLALRAHYQPGRVVLDLAQTNSNRCVVVTPEGWTVADVPPRDVVFQTSGAALPDPERGGSVDELRQLLRWNPDDERWMLVKGWLPCSLMADQNRPILCLFGPQGSAKSTTGRFVTGVFDPKPKGVLGGGFGKNRSDDETKALKHYVPAWDNVSTLSDEGADFLSRLVTGDLIEKRLLYSDADLVSISYRRTAVITGINMPRGVKPDTLDRLILVTLQHVEGARLTEGKLDAEWSAAQPRILAGVLDLAAKMLAGLPTAQNPADLRMADYAEALWAINPALYDAYRDNVNSTRGDMAHDDPFIQVLVEWLRSCEGQEWEGTADDAQQEAIYRADFDGKWWPKNGRVLSEQLNKCSELLRAVGVTVTERRSKKQRLKHFVLVEE
jgi:hypothetical protein